MSNTRVLIIDDNKTNILVLEQLLYLENATPIRLSGTDNLTSELNAIENVQVVFLDLEMPKMNGFEALAVIKSHPNFEASKVIACTVHVSELNTALDWGFDGFIGKPISAEAFPDQFRRILQGETVRYIP